MAEDPSQTVRGAGYPFPSHRSRDRAASAFTFTHLAARTSTVVGTPSVFLAAIAGILIWALLGPICHFSDTWQLIVNTATTIITFLMVFLIQNTQNRDSRAIHLKLDEIIRSIHVARNEMIDIEKLSDEELETLARQFEQIREKSEKENSLRIKSR